MSSALKLRCEPARKTGAWPAYFNFRSCMLCFAFDAVAHRKGSTALYLRVRDLSSLRLAGQRPINAHCARAISEGQQRKDEKQNA